MRAPQVRLATSVIVGVVSQTLIGCSRWQHLRMAKTAEDPIFVSMGGVIVPEYVGFLVGPGTHTRIDAEPREFWALRCTLATISPRDGLRCISVYFFF